MSYKEMFFFYTLWSTDEYDLSMQFDSRTPFEIWFFCYIYKSFFLMVVPFKWEGGGGKGKIIIFFSTAIKLGGDLMARPCKEELFFMTFPWLIAKA